MTDIIAEFGTKNQSQIKWYLQREPHDYMRPAWTYNKGLFVWCDEHLRWNQHGIAKEQGEETPGCITSRCPHHDDCLGDVYYCMGPADGELIKILKKYPQKKATHTAPKIRRVFPGELKSTDNHSMFSPISSTEHLCKEVYSECFRPEPNNKI